MKTNKFSISQLDSLIECFNEIEEFNITKETQLKLATLLKEEKKRIKKLIGENNRVFNLKMENTNSNINDMYQTITLILEDGSQHSFTGKAIKTDDNTVNIKDIQISEPVPLPDGCKFEVIDRS